MPEEELRIEDLKIDDEDENNGSTPVAHTPRSRNNGVIDQEAIEESLRAERDGVHQINTVIEGVVSSLQKARQNMEVVSTTVNNANKLLDIWVRILSQTEHTQRLLLSEQWQGLTADMASVEAAEAAKKRETERRAQEARDRAEAREREAAASEARRLAGEKKPRGIRKGGPTRGATSSKYGMGGSTLPPPASSTRGNPAPRAPRGSSTGTGRGFGAVKGRGRGAR
ncbi:DASH complex subunit Duo1-domain-containing protein [Geopyxis carbonaria]|nr:DASH complex subunit Duo1-domain-containing protein [Geopyxis carbonaria]